MNIHVTLKGLHKLRIAMTTVANIATKLTAAKSFILYLYAIKTDNHDCRCLKGHDTIICFDHIAS